MARSIRDSFSGFCSELLESIRENVNARLDEAAFEEKIIYLLQKYWDLRRSEANEFL